jgi:hypothetical protein
MLRMSSVTSPIVEGIINGAFWSTNVSGPELLEDFEIPAFADRS